MIKVTIAATECDCLGDTLHVVGYYDTEEGRACIPRRDETFIDINQMAYVVTEILWVYVGHISVTVLVKPTNNRVSLSRMPWARGSPAETGLSDTLKRNPGEMRVARNATTPDVMKRRTG